MSKAKYSKKKSLPLKISNEELWVQYNQKTVRRYKNTSASWKKEFANLPEKEQERLFYKYALEGNKKMLKFIYEQIGVKEIDLKDKDNNTPLLFAVKSGKREAMEYLLKIGANANHIDNVGYSPLHLAVSKNSEELVRVLLMYGADIEVEDNYNQTPIFNAVQERNSDMIEFLVVNNANFNHQNKEGRTPLMVAAFNRERQDVLCKLIRLGADVNMVDFHGRDAFMHAINNNNGAMMDILLKAGADINLKDNNGFTPLMLCAKRGNREGLRVLIARGANIFERNINGQSAYDIARVCKNSTCAEVLAKAERILASDGSDKEKQEQLKIFAKHNRMENSCIR